MYFNSSFFIKEEPRFIILFNLTGICFVKNIRRKYRNIKIIVKIIFCYFTLLHILYLQINAFKNSGLKSGCSWVELILLLIVIIMSQSNSGQRSRRPVTAGVLPSGRACPLDKWPLHYLSERISSWIIVQVWMYWVTCNIYATYSLIRNFSHTLTHIQKKVWFPSTN